MFYRTATSSVTSKVYTNGVHLVSVSRARAEDGILWSVCGALEFVGNYVFNGGFLFENFTFNLATTRHFSKCTSMYPCIIPPTGEARANPDECVLVWN